MKFIKKGLPYLLVPLAIWPLALSAAGLQVQVRDGNGHGVANAVVYAEPETPAAPAKAVAGIEIEQKERKFLPLVTVIQTGSQISFPNNDSVRHHIYSFSSPKKFEQKLYNGTAAAPVVFDKAGTVVLGCNIHDRMLAYIQVVDTPYFGKTDANGKVTLDRLPAGKYTVKAWHFNLIGTQPEQVQQLKQDRLSLEFKLNLKPVVEEKSRSPEPDYLYNR